MREIRVYLLAASRLVQDALTRLITRKADLQVVAAGACSPRIVQDLVATEYDVLLADWASGGPDLFETLNAVHDLAPGRKFILLGMKGDQETFLEAVKAGVKGILLEDASASDVAAAIRTVAAGQVVCPPSLCAFLFGVVARQSRHLPSARLRVRLGLTRREQQLLPLIARGFTNKEIALRLCLSEQTVKNHIHRMLQKTGTNDRLEVVEACDEEAQAWEGAFSRS